MKAQKVTLSSIATELNVSKTLVSLVLNGKADALAINKDTQRRVLEKARALNYKPNQVARGLRMGQTKTLGLLVADISNPFYARITRTIEHQAEIQGYSLIVCSSDENESREKRLLKMLLDRQVDGIIMTSTMRSDETLTQLIPQGFPLVLFDRNLAHANRHFVGVDNVQAVQQAISHLFDTGHENIGFISLTPDHISSLQDRRKGYEAAFLARNKRLNPAHLLQVDYMQLKEKQYEQISRFLLDHPEITALFTANNNLAVACLKSARELGISIPHDLSLITFDDVELFQYTAPALSSIAQPLDDIGRTAVQQVLKQLTEADCAPQQEILQTTFTIRESSCCKE